MGPRSGARTHKLGSCLLCTESDVIAAQQRNVAKSNDACSKPQDVFGCGDRGQKRPHDLTLQKKKIKHLSQRVAVSEVRLALPDFNNIAVRITDIAARLAVLLFGSVMNLAPWLRQIS